MTNQQFTQLIIKKYSRESVMAQREMAQLRAMFMPEQTPKPVRSFSLTRKERFYLGLCLLIVAIMAFSSGTSKADAGVQHNADDLMCAYAKCDLSYVINETPITAETCYGDKIDTLDSVYSDIVLWESAQWGNTLTSVLVPMPKKWASVTVCQ